MSEWIDFDKQKPPTFTRVLVVKQYLDAPYGENGYEIENTYLTSPRIVIDCYWRDWSDGGKVTHWMPYPKPPQE